MRSQKKKKKTIPRPLCKARISTRAFPFVCLFVCLFVCFLLCKSSKILLVSTVIEVICGNFGIHEMALMVSKRTTIPNLDETTRKGRKLDYRIAFRLQQFCVCLFLNSFHHAPKLIFSQKFSVSQYPFRLQIEPSSHSPLMKYKNTDHYQYR